MLTTKSHTIGSAVYSKSTIRLPRALTSAKFFEIWSMKLMSMVIIWSRIDGAHLENIYISQVLTRFLTTRGIPPCCPSCHAARPTVWQAIVYKCALHRIIFIPKFHDPVFLCHSDRRRCLLWQYQYVSQNTSGNTSLMTTF